MFERFTSEARQVIVVAQQEARALRHCYIGTEHLLIGLARDQDGAAARLLAPFGLPVQRIQAEVVGAIGMGDEVCAGQIPFTPSAKKALELALREALSLGQNWIGPEHILLGVIRIGDGIAGRILAGAGVALDTVRELLPDRVESAPHPSSVDLHVLRADEPQPRPRQLPWLGSLGSLLDRLAGEIRERHGREPDAGDLLLVLACLRDLPPGRALADLGVEAEELWAALERLRHATQQATAELEGQREQVRRAKEDALEAGNFEQAQRLRDEERALTRPPRAVPELSPATLDEIRRRLGLRGAADPPG